MLAQMPLLFHSSLFALLFQGGYGILELFFQFHVATVGGAERWPPILAVKSVVAFWLVWPKSEINVLKPSCIFPIAAVDSFIISLSPCI